jgi:hypothetical protein
MTARPACYIARLVSQKGRQIDMGIPNKPHAISFKGRVFRPRWGSWPDAQFYCWYDERPGMAEDDMLLTVTDDDLLPPEEASAAIAIHDAPDVTAEQEKDDAA